ncbi:MAG TPA: DUF3224 domain-containing protein [Thermoanaerobaculia bacterium]
MRTKTGIVAAILGAGLLCGFGSLAQPTKPNASPSPQETTMEMHARGAFDVKITPAADKVGDIARMALDKQYHGDLEATAKGEMLSVGSGTDGSGVYVAIEQVQGTLGGRTGGFALHHTGVMTRGTPQLTITVVPDSGTGQLAGISGRLEIKIENGKHSYDLAYTLPKAP